MNKSKIKPYAISIVIALAVGGISSVLTNMGMENYKGAQKPALTPPDIVFPIVWTILFILMGISAARVYKTPVSKQRNQGLIVYAIQLAVNFLWSIVFFNLSAYGTAFVVIILLWLLILLMIVLFSKSDKPAAYLQIPYLLWVTFAAYLNYMIWMLNK